MKLQIAWELHNFSFVCSIYAILLDDFKSIII